MSPPRVQSPTAVIVIGTLTVSSVGSGSSTSMGSSVGSGMGVGIVRCAGSGVAVGCKKGSPASESVRPRSSVPPIGAARISICSPCTYHSVSVLFAATEFIRPMLAKAPTHSSKNAHTPNVTRRSCRFFICLRERLVFLFFVDFLAIWKPPGTIHRLIIPHSGSSPK